MKTDNHGQLIYTEKDLCDVFLKNTQKKLKNCLVNEQIVFSEDLELESIPQLISYVENNINTYEFDNIEQQIFKMPKEYLELDIVKYVLDQCKTEHELQRVGEELLLYVEKDLVNLLRYLKYLVDTMRKYNVVWGVGRGSSVSSYVLYLIGVHKINSIFFDLQINEFLR